MIARETRSRTPVEILGRARPYALLLAGLGVLLWARTVYLQVVRSAFLNERARRQHVGRMVLPAARGEIYTRDGCRIAWNLWVDSVWADPGLVESPREVARRLADVLKLAAEPLARRIEAAKKEGKRFLWVRRWVEPETAARVERAGIPGVFLRKEPRRQYPWGEQGAAVLGFTGVDGKGLVGLEAAFDSLLSCQDGALPLYRDAHRRALVAPPESADPPPRDGTDLRLTLDSLIQSIVEQEISAAWGRLKASRMVAMVMDTRTGEILGTAARPTYDANAFRSADPKTFLHGGVSYVYEPGSTFKPFILAMALGRRRATLEERLFCHNGEWKVGSRTLRDHHPYGWLSVRDVVVHSSNIGIAQVGARLAPAEIRAGLAAFGFGQRTGVDLPGEERGILRPLSGWSRESCRSIPMGYEIAVTPVQLLAAYNVFANGGVWVRPHLVQGGDPSARRVLSEGLAAEVRSVLEAVVARGTGREAQCAWPVAGKTGTTKKLGADGRYSNRYIASFASFAPADNPRVTVLVVVDDPRGGEYYGGAVAAPIAREITSRTLSALKVPVPAPTGGAQAAAGALRTGARRPAR